LLILFTRCPEPGRVKTRLIPALGAERAADLHARMVKHTLRSAHHARQSRPIDVEVWFAGGTVTSMQSLFGSGECYRTQTDGDLGARLTATFRSGFDRRCERIVAIGTDCPALSALELTAAFDALDDHDVVLGPARDGGYYLIGLRRTADCLFEGVSWSTDAVLRQTLEIAREAGLSCTLLTMLDDVDRPEDLPIWERYASRESIGSADEVMNSKP
jgi:rSAM/selenodomain-associated transferase 1